MRTRGLSTISLTKREIGLAALAGLALAMLMHWPLPLHIGSDVPKDLGDPLPQTWQIAWGGHALQHQPLDYWQSNMYWPLENSLAFSDALVGYAPFGLIGEGFEAAIARYDLVFLFAYALAFVGGYLLARELGVSRPAAVVAGVAFAYAPWRLEQDGHMHVLSSGGIPLALALLVRGFGDDHPDIATLEHNLGGLEHARRDFAAAEPHARASVELRRRLLGPDHVSTAEDEAALAPILHALGRDEEAEALLRHALEILERELGPDHPEVAGAWNNLGSTLADPDASGDAYRRALAVKERSLGPEHPSVAITLNNLAVNAKRRGALDEAEALYRRSLEILEGRVDPDHPNLALTRRNLDGLAEERKNGDGSSVL